MPRWMLPLLAAACIAPFPCAAAAQTATDDSIAAHLMRVGERRDAPGVVLRVEPGTLTTDEARRFAEQLARGLAAIQSLLGRPLDTAHYEDEAIQVFVGRGIRPSHVYGGYAHMQYRRAWLYLDAELVRAGAAPYLHELTHILAWRFGSHSLREGLASYVELEVSAAGAGWSGGLFGMRDAGTAEQRARELLQTPGGRTALPWVGRGGTPDRRVTATASRQSRAAYYVLSQSFARHLVERLGLPVVLALYEADDVERAAESATGRSLEAWKREWLDRLTAGAGTASGAG